MRYILILLLLFILGIGTCFAQENLFYGFENIPLKDLIQQLEKDLGLSFSFADDAIESLFDPEEIEPDADELSDLDGEEADHG